jgi:hypothetical protein
MRYAFAFACFVLVCAMPFSAAWAAWGCGYRFSGLANGRYGSVWGEGSADAAREAAMRLCTNSGHQGCTIVGCSDNVGTRDQAEKFWPINGPVGNCYGNGCR